MSVMKPPLCNFCEISEDCCERKSRPTYGYLKMKINFAAEQKHHERGVKKEREIRKHEDFILS